MTSRSRLGPTALLLVAAVVFAGLPGGGFTSAGFSDSESVGVSFQGATEAGNTGVTASETGSPSPTSTPAPDESSTTETEKPGTTTPASTDPETEPTDTETPTAATEAEDR